MPKELMPAARVPRRLLGQSAASVGNTNGDCATSKLRLTSRSLAHGERRP